MEIEEHKREFDRIIEKYGLKEKAGEIADFLIREKTTSHEDFAKLFNMSHKDAEIFLKFIEKGVSFKEKTGI